MGTPEQAWVAGAEARAAGIDEWEASTDGRVASTDGRVTDFEGRIAGIERQTARLEEARAGLWESLKIPGVEGQAGIFARLEDLREALEALRRELRCPFDTAESDSQPGREAEGILEAEKGRNGAAAAIRNCQETLQRVNQVFAFLGGMIEDRAGQTSGDAYRFAQPGLGRRQPANREGAGSWEG